MNKQYPQVALVGRTNAGKSTLFNRLSETKKAIVSPLINTTRDRNFADIGWNNKIFTIIDTGGLDTAASDALGKEIQKQAQYALESADLILFIVDGSAPVLPQDKELAKILYKTKKTVVLGINKVDNLKKQDKVDPDFSKLNFKYTANFSALNGSQTGDLLDLIVKLLPENTQSTENLEVNFRKDSADIKLAILGRPNVGKSSLINAILGEERVIVSNLAHTTRDINDVEFVYDDQKITLIDTAGLRRKSRVGNWKDKLMNKIEKQGVSATVNALDEADIIVLVFEAQKKVTSQDQALVQLCVSHHKKLMIVINKWDLVPEKDDKTIKEYAEYFDSRIPFAKWAPMIFVSAIQGQRVKKILDLALEIQTQSQMQIPTEELNEIIDKVFKQYNPKQRQVTTFGQRKKSLVIKKLSQTESNPPVFKIKTPTPKNMPPAIIKIIEKEIRERYEFLGIPLRVFVDK